LAVIDPSDYAVVQGSDDLSEIVKENFGGEQQISQFDLTQVRVPGGGGTMWTIPSVLGASLAGRPIPPWTHWRGTSLGSMTGREGTCWPAKTASSSSS
jgi:hypothetical protein